MKLLRNVLGFIVGLVMEFLKYNNTKYIQNLPKKSADDWFAWCTNKIYIRNLKSVPL